jgi:acyl-CoA thioesterase
MAEEREPMMLTAFSRMLATMKQHSEQFTIVLPSDWLQGRTAYGGLSAALCLEAALRSAPDLPPLRSAQFAFVGPASGDLNIKAVTLRRGKSTVFTQVDLEGDHGLAVRGILCFGAARESALAHVDLPIPVIAAAENCPDYFTLPDLPNFMRHFDGRLAAGAKPVTPGAAPEMLVWLRHRDDDAADNFVSLLALADALPPAAMVLFKTMAPISTMTWSIDILTDSTVSQKGWWLTQCKAETANAGYSAQSMVIWDATGLPVLAARQNVAIFQ